MLTEDNYIIEELNNTPFTNDLILINNNNNNNKTNKEVINLGENIQISYIPPNINPLTFNLLFLCIGIIIGGSITFLLTNFKK